MSQAMRDWAKMMIMAYLIPSSFLTVAIAATHGVYKSEKSKKVKAQLGVVIPEPRIWSVLTTFSFAKNPVIRAVTIFQLSRPSGRNIGVNTVLIWASKLWSGLETMFKRASKVFKTQTAMLAINIILNAFLTKLLAFEYISFPRLGRLGHR